MTTSSEPLGPAIRWSNRLVQFRFRAATPLLAIFVLLLVAAIAYTLGTHRSSSHITSGYAYATPDQISASSHGWSYDIPLNVMWRDATGGLHEGSRPACLPASTQRLSVTFAWVPVHAGSATWRAVTWVDCDGSG